MTTETVTYDGDGNRVKKEVDGVVTYYLGGIYELSEELRTSYYYVAGQRVAMRVGAPGTAGTLTYLHGDHLGSTSLATDANGVELYRRGYYPFGEERYASGVAQTDYGFTGQREEAYIDLYEMGARWYDPYLNRFVSADTIVPNPLNPQSLNRYSYVLNNPLRYTDPSGHKPVWGGLVPYDVMTGPNGAAIAREAGQIEYHPHYIQLAPGVETNPYYWCEGCGPSQESFGESVRKFVWQHIACGVHAQQQLTLQGDVGVSRQVSFQTTEAVNYFAGEASFAVSTGSAHGVTTPNLVSVSSSNGVGFMYGYHHNDLMLGPSAGAGGSASLEAGPASFGGAYEYSEEMYRDPDTGELVPHIGSELDMQPYMATYSLQGGVSALSVSPLDVEYHEGQSYTHRVLTVVFHPWRWLSEPIVTLTDAEEGVIWHFP